MKAIQKCDELFKLLITKENDVLKAVLAEKEKQNSELVGQLDELKSHKDLVIKKLKLKLKKELSDKEKLNESLTKSDDMSSILSEKETIIQDLHSEISQKSSEHNEFLNQYARQVAEKDDLNKALKDELTWLKESFTRLM
jgi:hypothetical protein